MKILNSKAISKTIAAVIIVILVVAVAAAAYYFTPKPTTEKTSITYAQYLPMSTLDPRSEHGYSVNFLCTVYEPLLWYDPIENELIPALATSWEIKENSTVWIFHLREGVTFHDGTPFNATSVKYSVENTLELGEGFVWIWEPVDKIDIIDDYTVKFNLKYPVKLGVIAAAVYAVWIFSPNTPNTPEWFNSGNEAGSGPYKLVKGSSGEAVEVVLEKYEDWWGWNEPDYPMASNKAPDIFVIKIVDDEVTQEGLVQAGEIDIAEVVPLEDIEMLKTDSTLQVITKPSFQNLLLLLNTRKAPLNNTLVRRAIAHAINYDDVVDAALSGMGRVASGPVTYGMPGHFEDLGYEYNLTMAKELLAEAGYPNGGFKLVMSSAAGVMPMKRSGEILKVNLNQLGIELEIREMSGTEMGSWARSGWENPDEVQDILMYYWWPSYISSYDFLYNMFHNEENKLYNLCYYTNPEFDALVDQAYHMEGTNFDEAMDLYHQAQKILYDDVPGIGLWDMVDVKVGVKGIGNLENAINPAYPKVVFPQTLSVEK